MADFYQVTLTRFGGDAGFTDSSSEARELARLSRSGNAQNADRIAQLQNKLGDNNSYREGNQLEQVVFQASPTVNESRVAEYVDQGLPGPVGIVVYTITQNRRFNISGKLISTTVEMASTNFRYANLLRSWQIPFSDKEGSTNATGQTDGSSYSGRPPVLRLNGYQQQFFNIPVVLSELSISYPDDVDYISTIDPDTEAAAMVPIIQSFEINLIEAHSRYNKKLGDDAKKGVSDKLSADFDLALFKQGNLPGY